MANLNDIIDRLRARREALDLSLEDVGRMVDKHRSTVHAWEQKRTDIPCSMLVRWARSLGYELDWSLGATSSGAVQVVADAADVDLYGLDSLLRKALSNLSDEERVALAAALLVKKM